MRYMTRHFKFILINFQATIWISLGLVNISRIKSSALHTEVYIGLLSLNATQAEKVPLLKGTCFYYNESGVSRCKYYGDCCPSAPPHPLEQLPLDTFSCHDGFYIVDRCPSELEDENLRNLCENSAGKSEFSLSRWPVQGVANQLSYKNIYCAICNGVDPGIQIDLSHQTWFGSEERRNDTVNSIEWWTAKVDCELGVIAEYLDESPDHSKLIKLIDQCCQVNYVPPHSLDQCFDSVKTCYPNSNKEIVHLCEQGLANYINVPSIGLTFRNQFCALCNGVNLSLTDYVPTNFQNDVITPLQFTWARESTKILKRSQPISDKQTLIVGKLQLFDEQTFSSTSFSNDNNRIVCSYFVNQTLNYCMEQPLLTKSTQLLTTPTTSAWNLGSFACFSDYPNVCNFFAISRVDTDADCTEPGCGVGHMLDPATLTCQKISDLHPYSPIQSSDIQWTDHSVCAYRGQCKAVELGFIEENKLNCYCDKFCIYFNDCCEDSPFQPTNQTLLEDGVFSCEPDRSELKSGASPDGFEWGIMEVDKCPESFTNTTTRNLCENSTDGTMVGRSIPVTDTKTGLRYANIYCAQCHQVEDIRYWRIDIGCIPVANDECRQPLNIELDEQFYNYTQILRSDPSLEQLQDLGCKIKQYLPPLDTPTLRRCRYDSSSYITTCPHDTKYWKKSQLCTTAPTSFVYETGSYHQTSTRNYSLNLSGNNSSYQADYRVHSKLRKFRNSYCASCYSLKTAECNPQKTITMTNENEDLDPVIRHEFDVQSYLFVYQIDLNQRSCEMYSDSIPLNENVTTGFDTCVTVRGELHSCECYQALDLQSGLCLPTVYSNGGCLNDNYTQPAPNPSTFLKHVRNNSKISQEGSNINCGGCQLSKSCCKNSANGSNDEHILWTEICTGRLCYCEDTLNCTAHSKNHSCMKNDRSNIKQDAPSSDYHKVSYVHQKNELQLLHFPLSRYHYRTDLDPLSPHAIYGCLQYETLPYSSKGWSICRDRELKDLKTGERYFDFVLMNNRVSACYEYGFEFYVQTHDYVLGCISVLIALIYTIYYFTKAKKTTTGNFVVSSILTATAGQMSFMLIYIEGVGCKFSASLKVYLFLANHFWTTGICVWMFQGIVRVRVIRRRGWRTYIQYAFFAWVTPLVFVALAIVIDTVKIRPLYPIFTEYACFIGGKWAPYLFFLGPVYTLVFFDSTLCIIASIKVAKAGTDLTIQKKDQTKSKIVTILKLQFIFGVHWLLTLFTEIEGNHRLALWQIIKFFIVSQGSMAVLAQITTMKNVRNFKTSTRKLFLVGFSLRNQSQTGSSSAGPNSGSQTASSSV